MKTLPLPVRRSLLALVTFVAAVLLFGGPGQTRLTAQSDPNVLIDPSLYQKLTWRAVGPNRGGRVTAATGVRTRPNVFYLGASGGGVWKTTDYGITWKPVSDGQMTTPSIGAIDVADSNPDIVYVGTGSEAIRSNVILGRGVYKSTDAGKTWQYVGLKDVGQIGSVRVDPKNPDIVYVAALGDPFKWTAERGVYRTKDGGKSWQKVLFINNETGAVSLAINWEDPNEVIAGAWRAQRRPWTIISGGPAATGGIYRTIDGGDHWTHETAGLPKDLIGKVWVDIAQSDPKVVYAMVEAPGPEGGLYRSEDGGVSWQLRSNSPRLRARPFYFNYVEVNPKNENEVWVSELGLHKSTDGGKTWTTVETPHGDNHGIWFNPDHPQIAIEYNDGGANVTQDGGKSWSSIMNQLTGEFYMVDTDRQFPFRIYGPQQDNSTVVLSSLPPVSWPLDRPEQAWGEASGCESGQIRPDPSGRVVYGDCKGEFGRYDTETGQEQMYWINPQQRYGLNPKDQIDRFVRQGPIEVDPLNPKIVYHGAQYLFRTTDGGVHWQKISPDLTADTPETQTDSGEPITRDMTGEEVYSALYAIRASREEPGVIWTGSNDGPVWVTRDGGKVWKNVTPPGPAGGRVHTIEDSPHRKGSAYVSIYRIYFGDYKPYLYTTNDYGAHWTLLTNGTNGIPDDFPMHVVREDPEVEGLLYAGTWYGAFVSFDNGGHWQTLQQNLPAVAVTDIKVVDNSLVISTMGRGFWIMDDVEPLRQLALSLHHATRAAAAHRTAAPALPAWDPAQPVFLFKPAPAYRMRYVPIVNEPGWPTYPPAGAYIDYTLPAAQSGDLTLDILDGAGHLVRRYSSAGRNQIGGGYMARRFGGLTTVLPKQAGMNRFVWDLRYFGAWSPSEPEGTVGGPMVPPGVYTVRLKVGDVTKTTTVQVRIDPRVAKAGITEADLTAQAAFSLKVRDLLSQARQLADQLHAAMQSGSGDRAAIEKVYYELENTPGPYTPNMLIAQISNIEREVAGADQKVPASAYTRYDVVAKDLARVKADAAGVLK
ncbi:MAG: hypothetical protein KGN76_02110 [Acidobacteriota bacterium]|nr:hypothetical protein [Acidobacteriota bacterium]